MAVTDLLMLPLVAFTVRVLVAILALEVTLAVRVEVPLALAIVVGLRARVSPVTAPEAAKVTVPVKPPTDATLTAYVVDTLPVAGRVTVRDVGVMAIVNVGAVTTRVAVTVCARMPSVPLMVKT